MVGLGGADRWLALFEQLGGGEKFGGGSREQLDAPRSASLPAARFSGCLGTRSRSQSEQKAERGNNWKIKP